MTEMIDKMYNKGTPVLKEGRIHGTDSFPCALYLAKGRENFSVKHHWHKEVEIVHFSKGVFCVEVNMDKYTVAGECFCLLNSGELHAVYAEGEYEESAVVFDPRLLSFDFYDKVQSQVIGPLMKGDIQFLRFIYPEHKGYHALARVFEEMRAVFLDRKSQDTRNEHVLEDVAAQLYIKSGLLKFFAHLSEMHMIERGKGEDDYRVEAVKTVLSYIREHYSEKIYISDLAGKLNMNEQYFSRFFKKIIGKTPVEYMNEYRVKRAKELLETTDKQVMDICLDCGFRTLGNFLREFRKHTSCTPLQYRKNIL